jgi:hypothetical protein
VSKLLGNTPAICRKCYIHPAIFEGYLDGSLLDTLKKRATEELEQDLGHLKPAEAAVTGFLAHRLVQAVNHPEAEPEALSAVNTQQVGTRASSRPKPAPRIVVAASVKVATTA